VPTAAIRTGATVYATYQHLARRNSHQQRMASRASSALCGEQSTRVPLRTIDRIVIPITAVRLLRCQSMTAASKRVVSGMETLAKECDRTACSLACELIDKLTVIVGNRDLLREEMEAGSADSKRLDLIRGMAKDRQ
jgi:hypothetical protein